MPKLMVIIASTRPGRIGLPIGKWFADAAQQHGGFEVQIVDLLELDLPFMNEPKHPRFGEYQYDHTKKWSRLVASADAFAFVMPEYNYAMTAPLKNALDYLSNEWQYKPVGFVSYGGISAGLRAVQMVKQVVTTLKMMPLAEGVAIPFAAQFMKEGTFVPNDITKQATVIMLDELFRFESALRAMRQ